MVAGGQMEVCRFASCGMGSAAVNCHGRLILRDNVVRWLLHDGCGAILTCTIAETLDVGLMP